MCWYTKKRENVRPHTAKADIPVFKVVTRRHEPFYFKDRRFIYTDGGNGPGHAYVDWRGHVYVDWYAEGCTYEPARRLPGQIAEPLARLEPVPYEASSGRLDPDVFATIDEGMHSYSPDVRAVSLPGRDLCVYAPTGDMLDIFCEGYAERMDCVIPAGSTYYLNERGEYVSDMIRVTGFRHL